MSVINRVLKDLDRKGGTPATPAGVQAVQAGPAGPRRRWPWLLLPLLPLAAWWFWPVAEAPPTQETAREPAGAQLRMSDTLSPPTLPPAPPSATAPDVAPAPIRAEATAPATAQVATRPTPPHAEPPVPIRLDSRLSETPAPRIVKETRPPSASEQAEQAWRQATRLIELGRGHAGMEGLEATLRLDPGHGPARQTLVALSLEAGDNARGETLLREGLQLHPNDIWYHKGLAQLALQRGELHQAASQLKAGIGKGADADYWSLYAGVLGKAGRPDEAAQAWREATRLNPAHGPAWLGLAVSLEQTGQRANAATAYQRALQTRLSQELREFAARKFSELTAH